MSTAPDPLVGRRLANYRLERTLARGGMAQVYLGRDVTLNRPVAVKIIDARFRDNPDYAERFIREARLVATLHHPHIMQIFYAAEQDGLYYYAMEFVEGLDLASLIDQYRRDGLLLSHDDVLRIARALAKALDFAHSQGVVHRDVKPSNVMVSGDGRVLLGDFGLAMDTSVGSLGEVFGSPHYMAPEQARHSASAVPQSDLYSLGVMLYEMLTGVVPFDDPAPATLALQHITAPPPPPRQVNPALGAATEQLLLRALSKHPAERYDSGALLLDALAEALDADGSAAAVDGIAPGPAAASARGDKGATVGDTRSLTLAARISLHLADQGTQLADRPALRSRANRPGPRRQAMVLTAAIALIVIGVIFVFAAMSNRQPAAADVQPARPVVAFTPVAEPSPTVPPAIINPPPTRTAPPAASVTPSPSSTPPPTAAPPTAPPAATSTILYPQGRLIRLVYNAGGFYLLNLSASRIDVGRLSFEAVPPAGTPVTFRFNGADWAAFFPYVQPDRCNYVELFRPEQTANRPAICRDTNAAREDIDPENAAAFWLVRPGLSQFRVLWNEGEIARCELLRGRCDAYLP